MVAVESLYYYRSFSFQNRYVIDSTKQLTNAGGILSNTLRPPIPEKCDPDWRRLMEDCWSADPDARPSFTAITDCLRAMSISLQSKSAQNKWIDFAVFRASFFSLSFFLWFIEYWWVYIALWDLSRLLHFSSSWLCVCIIISLIFFFAFLGYFLGPIEDGLWWLWHVKSPFDFGFSFLWT